MLLKSLCTKSSWFAHRTGALHVGDRLLAINGVSLRGKTLTDAVHLLQNAGDTVTLKITRPANSKTRGTNVKRNIYQFYFVGPIDLFILDSCYG